MKVPGGGTMYRLHCGTSLIKLIHHPKELPGAAPGGSTPRSATAIGRSASTTSRRSSTRARRRDTRSPCRSSSSGLASRSRSSKTQTATGSSSSPRPDRRDLDTGVVEAGPAGEVVEGVGRECVGGEPSRHVTRARGPSASTRHRAEGRGRPGDDLDRARSFHILTVSPSARPRRRRRPDACDGASAALNSPNIELIVRCVAGGDQRERSSSSSRVAGRTGTASSRGSAGASRRLPVFDVGERVAELHGAAGLVAGLRPRPPGAAAPARPSVIRRIGIGVEPLHVETETSREARTDLVVRATLADPIDHRGDALAA